MNTMHLIALIVFFIGLSLIESSRGQVMKGKGAAGANGKSALRRTNASHGTPVAQSPDGDVTEAGEKART